MTDVPEPRDGIRGLVPILAWLPRYDRAWLRGDLAAGIAVTALILVAAMRALDAPRIEPTPCSPARLNLAAEDC